MALHQRTYRILIQEAGLVPVAHGRYEMLVKAWVRVAPAPAICAWCTLKDVVIEPH